MNRNPVKRLWILSGQLVSGCSAMAADKTEPRVYTTDQVRQGEIILKTPLRRLIFIAGLAGIVLVAIFVIVFRT